MQQKGARKRAEPTRDKMLIDRLALAVEKGDKKKISGIKQILNTEDSKKNWGIVNAPLDDPRSPPLTSIIREEGDLQVRYDTEEGVERVFMETCIERYNMAKKAPIMSTSLAQHEDVLKADFDHLISIIEGKTPLPLDLDEVTKAYLEEIIILAAKNVVNSERKPEMNRHNFSEF